jgi:uncharacterized protein YndB with AHSA1/START domain
MSKYKFSGEYELKISPKVLFPYLSTASGLQQWFATKVNMRGSQGFDFVWDGESHLARQTVLRLNKVARYDFENEAEGRDMPYIEMKIDFSDLTQTSFLKITDYSNNTDPTDLNELWEGLIENLRDAAGC